MHLNISHRTTYRYEQPLGYGLQELRLTPRNTPGQGVTLWQVGVSGGKVELEFEDQHQNAVQLVSFEPGVSEIVISAQGMIETTDTAGVSGRHSGFAPLWYFARPTDLTRAGNLTRKLTKGLLGDYDDTIARLHALCDRVADQIEYLPGHTDVLTTAEDALGAGRGVCQDQAHVFIAAARSMGMPSRYVSGYLLMEGQTQQDATHAWAEAHVEGIGWIGFDIANAVCPDERYVRVATGLDYREAAPVSGLRMGEHGKESLAVDIQVQQQ